MNFRLHSHTTNDLLTEGFVVTPKGDVRFEEIAPIESYTLHKGTCIGGQTIFVGDAVLLDLKANKLDADLMNGMLEAYGLLRTPNEEYDTLVFEVIPDADDDNGYGMLLFQKDGVFLQEVPEQEFAGGNYTIPLDGLSYLPRLLYNKTFQVTYNVTLPNWQTEEWS